MSNYTTKNYREQGGKKWVIGGELALVDAAVLTIDGEPVVFEQTGTIPDASVSIAKLAIDTIAELDSKLTAAPAGDVEDSEANTIAALKDDFNSLLASLRTAGILTAPED